jgi:DNA-binding ferritin-like protein
MNATSNAAAAELIARCFKLRTDAHILHLGTHSYEVHVALNELYEGIVPLADSFAEAYQGDFGLVDIAIPASTKPTTPLALVNTLTSWIDVNRKKIGDENSEHLQALIDDILTLLSHVRYKLRFLG